MSLLVLRTFESPVIYIDERKKYIKDLNLPHMSSSKPRRVVTIVLKFLDQWHVSLS